jgi:hypothetical protein
LARSPPITIAQPLVPDLRCVVLWHFRGRASYCSFDFWARLDVLAAALIGLMVLRWTGADFARALAGSGRHSRAASDAPPDSRLRRVRESVL